MGISKNKPELGEALPFEILLGQLRQQDDVAWKWLLKHLREKVVPYIRKIDGYLRSDAIVSVDYFVEEIFANSLIKFYELFDKGEFKDLGQIRGLMFRIAELKLKEAYKKVDRDQLLYFSEETVLADSTKATDPNFSEEEKEQQAIILRLEDALNNLSETDRKILLNYAHGKKLKETAIELNIKETACRKKKQRALDKLRTFLKPLYLN